MGVGATACTIEICFLTEQYAMVYKSYYAIGLVKVIWYIIKIWISDDAFASEICIEDLGLAKVLYVTGIHVYLIHQLVCFDLYKFYNGQTAICYQLMIKRDF